MLQPGRVLHNHYCLKQQLGQNAGRQTWLAEDNAVQPAEPVIVKLLTFSQQTDWDSLKLFERETQVLRQLSHPRLPTYKDSFSIDEPLLWLGLVQAYIPGASLKEKLAQGQRFRETEIRAIAAEILQILIYLHELSPPVLHRDIKPSNLIQSPEGEIYLIDLGAVQDRAATEDASFTVVGTYGYTPMEQFGGRAVAASDLYALGATLVHLLTGVAPADLPQHEFRLQFADRVSVSPDLVRWLERLTEPDVTQRFATARQALGALEQAAIADLPPPPQTTELALVQVPAPAGSLVKLRQSATQLLIEIPGLVQLVQLQHHPTTPVAQPIPSLPTSRLDRAVVAGIGLFVAFAIARPEWAGFAVLIGVLGVLAVLFLPDMLPTVISVEADRFLIYKTILGRSHILFSDQTAAIQTIELATDPYQRAAIAIQPEGRDRYYLGGGLTETDCEWIVQHMNDWLHSAAEPSATQPSDEVAQ